MLGVDIYEPQAAQNEAAKTHGQKITFLSFQMANLDGTKSALAAKDAAQMNSAVWDL